MSARIDSARLKLGGVGAVRFAARFRSLTFFGAVMAATAPLVIGGCGDVSSTQSPSESPGMLELRLAAQLDGATYWLEATFDVTGPESHTLSSTAGQTTLTRALAPGDYTLDIRPDFRVLRAAPEGLVPVEAALASEATRTFSITDQNATRVSYRFRLNEGSIETGSGSLEVDFQVEKAQRYLTTWGGARWYRVPVQGAMTDAAILAACQAAGLGVPCQTQTAECAFNDSVCSPITGETWCGNPMLGLAEELCGAGASPAACEALQGAFQYMGEAWHGGCGALPGQWCVSGDGYFDADALCTSPEEGGGGSGVATTSIAAPGTRSRLLYDAERSTLYGVNRDDQLIERYRYEGGDWQRLDPLVVPQLSDAVFSPDHQKLIVGSGGGIGDVLLDAEPPLLVSRVPNPDPFCGQMPNRLAMGADGQALVVYSLRQCSGFTLSARYDSRSFTLASNPYPGGMFYEGLAAASGDGSRIYAGSNGISPADRVTIFTPPGWAATASSVAYNLYSISISDDASRVILQDTDVLDQDLNLLGYLAPGGATIASHDSTRAFSYREGEARLVTYALDAPLEVDALYPESGSVTLDPAPTAAGWNDVSLAATPDDTVVFVSGFGSIAVVPMQ